MKLTREIIIKRSEDRFGKNRFDYSQLTYINKRTKIKLICSRHQEPFEVLIQNHFKANKDTGGCPICLKVWKKEVFPKLVSDKTTFWTKEKIFEEAKKHKSKTAFRDKADAAYRRAKRGGFLDEVIAHMPERDCFRHTLETLKPLAKKFKTRTEFARANSWAYMRASQLGLLDEICAHMVEYGWNRESITLEAKKYKTKNEFRKSCGGGYNYALQQDYYNEITAHMETLWEQKWDYESVKKAALNCETKAEFSNKYGGALSYVQRNNLESELCSHFKPYIPSGPWKDKELILNLAKKCKTRSGFERLFPEAYAASRRHGWHKEACAHMKAVDNGYYHCAYAIVNKKLNKAYIGITSQDFDSRMKAHKALKNSTNSSLISRLEDTEFIQLTKYVFSADDVKDFAEEKFVKQFEIDGYEILNDFSKIGAVGISKRKWDIEGCRKLAASCQTKTEFTNKFRGAYDAALAYGWLEEICSHMKPLNRSWTKEEAFNECEKYNSQHELREQDNSLYYYISNHGWLKEFIQRRGWKKWTHRNPGKNAKNID